MFEFVKRLVIFQATQPREVEAGDTLLDLGSGTGRTVLHAAVRCAGAAQLSSGRTTGGMFGTTGDMFVTEKI